MLYARIDAILAFLSFFFLFCFNVGLFSNRGGRLLVAVFWYTFGKLFIFNALNAFNEKKPFAFYVIRPQQTTNFSWRGK